MMHVEKQDYLVRIVFLKRDVSVRRNGVVVGLYHNPAFSVKLVHCLYRQSRFLIHLV